MTILCGTDFSEHSAQAARAAAVLAQRLGEPLKLLHVIDELGAELSIDSPVYDEVREQARREALDLHSRFAIDVEAVVLAGFTQSMLAAASMLGARVLVISSQGKHKQKRWLLGSTAERVVQVSRVPTLIVRDAAAIEAWLSGERALRVLVGVELSQSSKVALRWAASLREIGPCDLNVTQVVSPLVEHLRTGVPYAARPAEALDDEMRELLLRDLRAWVGELPGSGDTSLSVNPCFDRVAHRLAALAEQDKVDLLVLGMRSRPCAKQFWQGSVSREALASAACNVACVPMGDGSEGQPGIPTFRHVLIPTDFSPLANRAIPVGYGLLPMGGLVHLIHVSTHEEGPSEADRTRRLRALIPAGAAAKGVATEIELVNAQSACTGIWQAAERLGVDVLCMATHGRTGVARALMGSEAAQVIQHARRPVVLVPPDPDATG